MEAETKTAKRQPEVHADEGQEITSQEILSSSFFGLLTLRRGRFIGFCVRARAFGPHRYGLLLPGAPA